ncbi:MAG: HAD-IA family hydrolase [Actinomycetota bacterium]|nr:HAD-IA family hydrolase [Actinomycetota bacterium]
MTEQTSSQGGAGAESGPALPLRAVLFDLDGTLIDTVALILASMRHATEAVLGAALPDEVLMQGVGIPLDTQMRAISPDHAEELLLAYREHNWEVHDELIAEYPGTEEVLVELARRGLPMGIVTSKSRRVAMRGIERFNLARYFEVIVCSDDTEVHKPDPLPLELAADQLGVRLSQCAYVGDSPYDMQAALAGGAYAIAALWGASSAEEMLAPGPDVALESIAELSDVDTARIAGQLGERVEH